MMASPLDIVRDAKDFLSDARFVQTKKRDLHRSNSSPVTSPTTRTPGESKQRRQKAAPALDPTKLPFDESSQLVGAPRRLPSLTPTGTHTPLRLFVASRESSHREVGGSAPPTRENGGAGYTGFSPGRLPSPSSLPSPPMTDPPRQRKYKEKKDRDGRYGTPGSGTPGSAGTPAAPAGSPDTHFPLPPGLPFGPGGYASDSAFIDGRSPGRPPPLPGSMLSGPSPRVPQVPPLALGSGLTSAVGDPFGGAQPSSGRLGDPYAGGILAPSAHDGSALALSLGFDAPLLPRSGSRGSLRSERSPGIKRSGSRGNLMRNGDSPCSPGSEATPGRKTREKSSASASSSETPGRRAKEKSPSKKLAPALSLSCLPSLEVVVKPTAVQCLDSYAIEQATFSAMDTIRLNTPKEVPEALRPETGSNLAEQHTAVEHHEGWREAPVLEGPEREEICLSARRAAAEHAEAEEREAAARETELGCLGHLLGVGPLDKLGDGGVQSMTEEELAAAVKNPGHMMRARSDCDYWDEAEDDSICQGSAWSGAVSRLDEHVVNSTEQASDEVSDALDYSCAKDSVTGKRCHARSDGVSPASSSTEPRSSKKVSSSQEGVHALLARSDGASSSSHHLPDTRDCFFESSESSPNGVLRGARFAWVRGELVGRGSLGGVYKALDQSNGSIMAVKEVELNPKDDSENKFRRALENEIDLYKELKHPNIVSYLGHDYIEGKMYIYLEYMAAGSIAQVLSQFGALDESVMARYTLDIIQGLKYLHTCEPAVLHRDIKGANILVGLDSRVKLSDFGCSKRSPQGTDMHTMKGSVPWMAPEVMRQSGYGSKADIWSLGCVLIEMGTASNPWGEFDNPFSAMVRIAMSDETPPIPDHLSEVCRSFITACTFRSPEERLGAVELLDHPFVAGLLACDDLGFTIRPVQ